MKVHRVFEFTERFTGQESLHSLHTVGKEILATAVQFVAHLCNEIIVEHVQYQFIRSQAGAHSRYRLHISTDNAATALLRILAAIADNALVAIVLHIVCIIAIQRQARILAVVIVRVVLLLQLLVIAVHDVVAVVGGGIVAIFSLSCFSWIGIAAVQQQLLPRLCIQAIDVSIAAATVAQHLLRLNVQKATSDAMTRVYAISNVLDFISARRKNKHISKHI